MQASQAQEAHNTLSVGYFVRKQRTKPRESLQNPWIRIFLVLLAIDLVFIGVHMVTTVIMDDAGGGKLNITSDESYAETFQYFQVIMIALFLALLSWKRHSKLISSWVLVFAYIVIDDALLLHENFGEILAAGVGLPTISNLAPDQIGELLVLMIAAIVLVGVVLLNYLTSTDEYEKRASIILGAMFLLLSFCGVGMDILHSPFEDNRWLNAIFGILEDGGEMVVASVILPFVMYLTDHQLKKTPEEALVEAPA